MFKRKKSYRGTSSEYVERLVRKMGIRNRPANTVKGGFLVKSCLQQLSYYFVKCFEKLRINLDASLTKEAEDDSSSLCGVSLHTMNTEAFYPQAIYNQDAFNVV